MTSWQIVMAAPSELRKDRDATLRTFLGPVLLIYASDLVSDRLMPQIPPHAFAVQGLRAVPLQAVVVAVVLLLIKAALYPVAAVAWHRFVLAGEQPGRLFPRVHPKEALAYFGTGLVQIFLMVLIVLLLSVGVGAVIGVVVAILNLGPSVRVWTPALTGLFGAVFGTWLMLRLGSALPKVAMNEQRHITAGLGATTKHRKTLLGVTLLSFGFTIAIALVGGLISRFVPILALGSAFTNFALLAFNVALLTVLYQEYILKRDDSV